MNQSLRSETVTLLKAQNKEKFLDFMAINLGNAFLNVTGKAQATEAKISRGIISGKQSQRKQ